MIRYIIRLFSDFVWWLSFDIKHPKSTEASHVLSRLIDLAGGA